MMTKGNGNGAGFSLSEVLFTMDETAFAADDEQGEMGFVFDHNPIASYVDFSGLRVLSNSHRRGSNVAASVLFVPFRGRKTE